ncbi:DUF3500 domain-containing protein [Streptomyces sp. NPDC059893]|uniref:DUF3500 domain-containing protein n=1 Tax=Streptomyces sp. NPDC059893 TaxID=3346990 RepID=UPI0036520519
MSSDLALEMKFITEQVLASPGNADEQSARQLPYDRAAVTAISFRPHRRPGLRLGDASRVTRVGILGLLDLALSSHTYAQVATIMGLESLVARGSNWRKDQQSDDYYLVVHGHPHDNHRWGWRFEGHHISITATVQGDRIDVAPIFLGASPDKLLHAGRVLLHPLVAEAELARTALNDMGPSHRAAAIVTRTVPREITHGSTAQATTSEPAGVRVSDLPRAAQRSLRELASTYINRAAPTLATQQAQLLEKAELTFAWLGGTSPGEEFHYLLQAEGLFIAEYGNNSHGQKSANHVHTILRLPRSDFGGHFGPETPQ